MRHAIFALTLKLGKCQQWGSAFLQILTKLSRKIHLACFIFAKNVFFEKVIYISMNADWFIIEYFQMKYRIFKDI